MCLFIHPHTYFYLVHGLVVSNSIPMNLVASLNELGHYIVLTNDWGNIGCCLSS